MLNDFEMIVHELDRDLEHINIYPLGDLHIGSAEFNMKNWERWLETVKADPNGYVVMIGDLMDNGLKTSKTNTYEATMRPLEQKHWLRDQLTPIKDRILGVTQGNHEYRSIDSADFCPIYDVMSKLDKEDLYRQNMAFLKISLGEKRKDRQFTYVIVLAHGASKNRVDKFSYAIDGMDVLVTGHTHQGSSNFNSKIIVDPRNNVVSTKGFVHMVVNSFLDLGGYALRGMYYPQDNSKIPVITLNGTKKEVNILWK